MFKDHICAVPFTSLELHEHRRFLCCASWLKKYMPEDSSPASAWNSKEANDVRDSIIDGSYRHCDSTQCPFLNKILNDGYSNVDDPIYRKDDLPEWLSKYVEDHKAGKLDAPSIVQFSFDRSCNLACPSCRLNVIMASSGKIKESKATIEEIRETFGHRINTLYITGSGDPFVAVAFRDFLRDFDKSQWPELHSIHLHTNATMWTKEMWDSMEKVHPYIRSCEISIDAATKETYENETRLRGDWDKLIDNLKFIATIPTLKSVKPSFVVQQKNYKEVKMFYDLMNSIFHPYKDLKVYFNRITNWGTWTEEEFLQQDVLDINHPEYQNAVDLLNSFLPNQRVFHNLHSFIKANNSLI